MLHKYNKLNHHSIHNNVDVNTYHSILYLLNLQIFIVVYITKDDTLNNMIERNEKYKKMKNDQIICGFK